MNNPLISVIVPVYKAEKYLDHCVQSIIDQTYINIEIILVDDGSPDHCPAMCDAWAAKDSRVKVIHKKNGGAAQARNYGIACATGDFIAFVDSDDYIAPCMYDLLLSLITPGVDIAECCLVYAHGDTAEFDFPGKELTGKCVSAEEALSLHIENKCFCQTPVNKLYRKNVIEGILFVEGKTFDDEFWTYRAVGNARNLIYTDLRLYAYRQQEQSVMHTAYSTLWLQEIEARLIRHRYLLENYPVLASLSRINLLFSSMYHRQKCDSLPNGEAKTKAILFLRDAVRAYPVQKQDLRLLPARRRIWARLAALSFDFACALRKLLHIGY